MRNIGKANLNRIIRLHSALDVQALASNHACCLLACFLLSAGSKVPAVSAGKRFS